MHRNLKRSFGGKGQYDHILDRCVVFWFSAVPLFSSSLWHGCSKELNGWGNVGSKFGLRKLEPKFSEGFQWLGVGYSWGISPYAEGS